MYYQLKIIEQIIFLIWSSPASVYNIFFLYLKQCKDTRGCCPVHCCFYLLFKSSWRPHQETCFQIPRIGHHQCDRVSWIVFFSSSLWKCRKTFQNLWFYWRFPLCFVCPATCSFIISSNAIMTCLFWTSYIKLPFIYSYCVIVPVLMPPPCTAHTYDHWFERQPYLYKQISLICFFLGLQLYDCNCLLLITLQNFFCSEWYFRM